MIGEALKMIRVFHGLSQRDLADRLGVAPSYLSELESAKNKKQPTLQLLEKYAEEFKIPASSILFFSEAMSENSLSERTRLVVSKKILSMLNFIAERSGHAAEN